MCVCVCVCVCVNATDFDQIVYVFCSLLSIMRMEIVGCRTQIVSNNTNSDACVCVNATDVDWIVCLFVLTFMHATINPWMLCTVGEWRCERTKLRKSVFVMAILNITVSFDYRLSVPMRVFFALQSPFLSTSPPIQFLIHARVSNCL